MLFLSGDIKLIVDGQIMGEYDDIQQLRDMMFGKRKPKVRGDFVRVFTDDFQEMAKRINSLTTLKVRDIFLANIDWDGCIRLSQKKIGEILEIKQQQVGRAIKELEELGIIKIIKEGKNNIYMMNPSIAWKGDDKKNNELTKEYKTAKEKAERQGLTVVDTFNNEPMLDETNISDNELVEGQVQKQNDKCPNCGNELKEMEGRFGKFLGCTNFKQCKFKGAKIKV